MKRRFLASLYFIIFVLLVSVVGCTGEIRLYDGATRPSSETALLIPNTTNIEGINYYTKILTVDGIKVNTKYPLH